MKKKLSKNDSVSKNIPNLKLLDQICHELRSPLVGINGLIQRLTQDYKKDIYLVEHLRLMGITIEQMLYLTDNTLTFSQLQRSHTPLKLSPVNIEKFIYDITELLQPITQEKNLTLTAKINLEDDNIWVDADNIRLTQILNNLIINGIKFTKYGGVTVKVVKTDDIKLSDEIKLQLNNSNKNNKSLYCFTVSDSGMGIPALKMELIFKPYARIQDETYNSEQQNYTQGIGLGLNIVLQLVKQMEGAIEVNSKEGEGTEFNVYLYLGNSKKPDIIHEQTEQELYKPIKNKLNYRVLIADDSSINVKVLEIMLINLGCDVYTARNGEEAVQCIQKQAVDFIFLDIQMPIMDGIVAANRIHKILKEQNQKVCAMFAITAGKEVDLTPNFYNKKENLFTEWLSKPTNENQVIQLLEKYGTIDNVENNTYIDIKNKTSDSMEKAMDKLYPELINSFKRQQISLLLCFNERKMEEAAKIIHGMKGDAMVFKQQDWVDNFRMLEQNIKDSKIKNCIEMVKKWRFDE